LKKLLKPLKGLKKLLFTPFEKGGRGDLKISKALSRSQTEFRNEI